VTAVNVVAYPHAHDSPEARPTKADRKNTEDSPRSAASSADPFDEGGDPNSNCKMDRSDPVGSRGRRPVSIPWVWIRDRSTSFGNWPSCFPCPTPCNPGRAPNGSRSSSRVRNRSPVRRRGPVPRMRTHSRSDRRAGVTRFCISRHGSGLNWGCAGAHPYLYPPWVGVRSTRDPLQPVVWVDSPNRNAGSPRTNGSPPSPPNPFGGANLR